jgi:hypothetical protein
MIRVRLSVLVALITAFLPTFALDNSPLLARRIHHEPASGDLANVLAQVAYWVKIPMVAELAHPLPKIRIPEGSQTGRSLFEEISRQAKGYRWELDGSVIHYYNEQLRMAPANDLNGVFSRFVMPDNASDLKVKLPCLALAVLDTNRSGVLVSGFGDAALKKDPLQPATLVNISGRDILARAASESPTFFVVVVFPTANPTTVGEARRAQWFWQSFKSRLGPIYAAPPPDSDVAE